MSFPSHSLVSYPIERAEVEDSYWVEYYDCSDGEVTGGILHVTLNRVSRCLSRSLDAQETLICEREDAPPETTAIEIPDSALGADQELLDPLVRTLSSSSPLPGFMIDDVARLAGIMIMCIQMLKRHFELYVDVVIAAEVVFEETPLVCGGNGDGSEKGTEEGGDGACVICLEEMSSPSEFVEMPCSHRFHKDCIFSWLAKNPSCPLCRRSVFGH